MLNLLECFNPTSNNLDNENALLNVESNGNSISEIIFEWVTLFQEPQAINEKCTYD